MLSLPLLCGREEAARVHRSNMASSIQLFPDVYAVPNGAASTRSGNALLSTHACKVHAWNMHTQTLHSLVEHSFKVREQALHNDTTKR